MVPGTRANLNKLASVRVRTVIKTKGKFDRVELDALGKDILVHTRLLSNWNQGGLKLEITILHDSGD